MKRYPIADVTRLLRKRRQDLLLHDSHRGTAAADTAASDTRRRKTTGRFDRTQLGSDRQFGLSRSLSRLLDELRGCTNPVRVVPQVSPNTLVEAFTAGTQ